MLAWSGRESSGEGEILGVLFFIMPNQASYGKAGIANCICLHDQIGLAFFKNYIGLVARIAHTLF